MMKSILLLLGAVGACYLPQSRAFSIVQPTTHQQQCYRNNHQITSSTTTTTTSLQMSNSDQSSPLRIMVNGMPGPMATAAAEACLRKGLSLSPVAMTGPDIEPSTITVTDDITGKSSDVRLIPANDEGRAEIISCLAGLREANGAENILAIDYTHPSAVNDNAIFYAENNLPFVMGTTGGDRDQLMTDMESRNAFAVIAPNMGKQIVAMQAGLEDLATKFPNAFNGYSLQVTESHQKTKADTVSRELSLLFLVHQCSQTSLIHRFPYSRVLPRLLLIL